MRTILLNSAAPRRDTKESFEERAAARSRSVLLASACLVLLSGCDRSSDLGEPASFSPVEEVIRTDDRVVRCNTVHSLTLPPQILDRLKIDAQPNVAVVSCALQVWKDGVAVNIPAQVSGTATALSGNISQIEFKEVVEEETLSYLGTFAMGAKAGVRFDITVADPQTGIRYRLDFEQLAL